MTLDANQKTFLEKTTGRIRTYLEDEAGDPIPSADLVTLTLSVWEKKSGTTVNSRSAQSVLNTNNVTVHATSGLVTWSVQTGDTTLVDTTIPENGIQEFCFLYSWTTSSETGRHLDSYFVQQLLKVS